ncbi:YitT family protein [Algoriphagus sp. CAU 1675]|uniref:YitT family protein n=1 Tax=Algoriphagus sp. CAU 1675 TaxID=3032597 RepID=UPI0023D9C229|nr:YitT family protein [Algoriphagus sp. CAU 1675]MDF2156731.1 YitT family protein [Algoriphagus sp. CAU 1675]
MANTQNSIDWKSIFSPSAITYTLSGVALAAIALESFLLPNKFLDGGVTGIAILVNLGFGIDLNLLLVLINLPFLIMAYKKIGKTFAVQSTFSVFLLTIVLYFLEIPTITEDKVLIAVFGGFLMGTGIGLIIRGGGLIDGFEVITEYFNKNTAFTASEITLFLNSLIMLAAAFVFGVEPAMYSILTYFTAIKTTDYVVEGFEEYTALTIISKEHEKVKELIVKDFGKAISVYKGERGYLPETFHIKYPCDIIMTVVTRLEVHRIKVAIQEIDPKAFFYVQTIKEVKGGIIKQVGKKHV